MTLVSEDKVIQVDEIGLSVPTHWRYPVQSLFQQEL